jgi:hypothetical protein
MSPGEASFSGAPLAIDAGSLTIFGQIAIALAGFASLVSVIGAREGGDPPMLDANRLRNLVDTSLLVVVFSLLPTVFVTLVGDVPGVWRAASALYALCLLIWGVVAWRRQHRLRRAGIRVRRRWALVLWICHGIGTATLGLGAAGWASRPASGLYALGLMFNLIGACLIFVLVIGSILIPLFEDQGA